MKQKISQKINDLIVNRKNNHQEWIDEIKCRMTSYKISDYSFWQFPSYYISISLENNQINGVGISKRAIAVVSQLADYFTVYIEDEYQYVNLDNYTEDRPLSLVLSNKKCHSLEYSKLIESIIAITRKHFVNHEFINHKFLFNHRIYGGTVLSNVRNFDLNRAYTFYDFLFSSDKFYADALIILDLYTPFYFYHRNRYSNKMPIYAGLFVRMSGNNT